MVGLCTVVAVEGLEIFQYVFATYELALAQALENQKGVTAAVERLAELRADNGLRQTVFKIPALSEVILVAELEVGSAVLPVR